MAKRVKYQVVRESDALNIGRIFYSKSGYESKVDPKEINIRDLIRDGIGAGNQFVLLIEEPGRVSSVVQISQDGLSVVNWTGEIDFSIENYELNFDTKKNKLFGSISSAKKSPNFEVLGLVQITPKNELSVMLDLAVEPKQIRFERDIVRS